MQNTKVGRIITEEDKSNLITIMLRTIYQVDNLIQFESFFFNLESQWSWTFFA